MGEGCTSDVGNSVNDSVAIISASQKIVEKMRLTDLRGQKYIAIPEGVREIGEQWFKHSGIENILIPTTVERIGEQAFYGCVQLKGVKFTTFAKSN